MWELSLWSNCKSYFCWRQSAQLRSINSSNVVTMLGSDELLGVILSHGEYEMKETTTVSYNWQAVEKELVMKYQSNKPLIDFKVEDLQYYVFQEDFNLHNQLKSINDSQVSLISKLVNWLNPFQGRTMAQYCWSILNHFTSWAHYA